MIVGGEITAGWDLVRESIARGIRERLLTEAGAATPIAPASAAMLPRLRGAAALLGAQEYAAPRVA